MNQRVIIVCMVIIYSVLLPSASLAADLDLTVDLITGYRIDNLDLGIAGDINGYNPNVLSELKWTDVEAYQVGLGARALILDHYCARASISRALAYRGTCRDSDYTGDHRTGEYARSYADADDSKFFDLSVGLGYQFRFFSNVLALTPMAGFSYSGQKLAMTNGVQTVDEDGDEYDELGPLSGLDSTYEAKWSSWWAGIDLSVNPIRRLTIFGTIEYHYADYTSDADWNLREDLAHPTSFSDRANGEGVVISGGIGYSFMDDWAAAVRVDYQEWWTDSGIATAFGAFGGSSDTRLNRVNWDSLAIMLRLSYAIPAGKLRYP
ncbi:MAG: hypothetical protein V1736_04100 [Pseudomonadota bacterium]